MSRLNKTLEEVRSELFQHIENVQDEYASKGWLPKRIDLNQGIVRGIIEICAFGLHQLYLFLAFVLKQAVPSTADNEDWLDLHVAQIEIERKPAKKAIGNVIFSGELAGNIPIPAGRIIKTEPDGAGKVYRYITTADAVLPDGETEILIPAISEEYGIATNVTAGQITEIVTVIPGITEVRNEANWLTEEGTDKEENSALLERYRLKWLGNNGVTKYFYAQIALSVNGVIACKVLDQHPRGQGTVDIIIIGTAGIPTDNLITEVEEAIASLKPINDDVEVRAPVSVLISIDIEIELTAGVEADIIADVKAKITDLFSVFSQYSVTPFAIGEDVTREKIIYAIMSVKNIKRISKWNSPDETVEIPKDGLAILNTINITAIYADEI